jgi:2-polyprenyl-3-methyl-5-hydroxy-6-metoxy-1,4-benzoquinol methylase
VAREFRSYILRSFQGTNLNQYLTEQCVIAFMVNLVGEFSPNTKVLDFECGSGGFLAAVIDKGVELENIRGVDIDELPYIVAKNIWPYFLRKPDLRKLKHYQLLKGMGFFIRGMIGI